MKKPLLSCISGMFLLLAIPALAQSYTKTTLYDFHGADGSNPENRLILDKAGNLYGTTSIGGAGNNGTIFKVDPSGHETVLLNGISNPRGRLTIDAAGNLYGTTQTGGTFGFGSVFKLDTSGTFTVLYSFNGGQYGAEPYGGLLYLESEGSFFGTTLSGGDRKACGGQGCGVVYKLAPNSSGGWIITILHLFTGTPDGAYPTGELTRDPQGYLYGTTENGGTSDLGTAFKVRARQETVLYSFKGGADGQSPGSGLLRDAAGNLYGTTELGGGGTKCVTHSNGCGTVFEIDTNDTETVLYAFTGRADGANPSDRLVMDAAENLYGTTTEGGEKPYSGTVYKVDMTGHETVLHNFLGGKDGRFPDGLAIDAAGNLYGVTYEGGLKTCSLGSSCGTVFKLAPHDFPPTKR
jgi:uncharacterized repeat protein (TIGR03803 family)